MRIPFVEKSSDIYVSDFVMVSAQVYRDKKKLKQVISLLPYIEKLFVLSGVLRKPAIRFAHIRGEDFGFCMAVDSSIEICVRKIKTSGALLRALAHELVHASQFQTKRLVFKPKHDLWEGKKFVSDNHTHAGYRSQPWEIEAFKLEGVLSRKAIHQVKSERAKMLQNK
jgi:hypothetical protein